MQQKRIIMGIIELNSVSYEYNTGRNSFLCFE